MPTYEYECEACGHKFERFQSIKAEPIRKCPECGKNKVKRLIGIGAGMIFKGSGFYITDYRDSSYNDKAKADSAPSTGGDEKKSDTKPAGGQTSSSSAEPKPAAPPAKSEAPPAKPQKASRSAKKK